MYREMDIAKSTQRVMLINITSPTFPSGCYKLRVKLTRYKPGIAFSEKLVTIVTGSQIWQIQCLSDDSRLVFGHKVSHNSTRM